MGLEMKTCERCGKQIAADGEAYVCGYAVHLKSESIIEAHTSTHFRKNIFDERQMIAVQLVG